MWETGLRRSTVRRLSVPEHFTRGRAELRITKDIDKARYARVIPITPAAQAELDALAPKRGRVFDSVDYRHTLKKAALAAGLDESRAKRLGSHTLRHARTTHLLDSGASLTGTAYLMGHLHVSTTDRYAHAKRRAAEEALGTVGHKTGHRATEAARAPKRKRRKSS
jgi:integrase